MNEHPKNRETKFNARVAAVALHQGRVLLHRVEVDDFWSLPGGRIESGESSADALRREMEEEMNVAVSIERLIWVAENVFEYENQSYHEIGFYYLVDLPRSISENLTEEPFYGKEGKLKIIFKWFPLENLDGIDLKPPFLAQALRNIPSTIMHIIHLDE